MNKITSSRYSMDMCSGKIYKKILLFALPLMATSILQLLYNAADIVVIGNFREHEALSAISSTSSLINLIVNLFIGLSVGTNVLIARYFGSKDLEKSQKVVHTSILASLFAGLFLAALGFLLSRDFLELMGSPSNVIDLADIYLKIYFLGMPFNLLFNFGSSILRGIGDTKRPLLFLSVSGILNVGANLIFVLVFNMSTDGVALATILSQALSAILVLIALFKEKDYVQLTIKNLKIDPKTLLDIAKIGLPAGIQGVIFSISNVLIQSSVNMFGSLVMAGNGAASNLEGFVYVSMNAFYQAAITFTSQNIGAKKYQNIKPILKYCLYYAVSVGAIMGLGVYALSPNLIRIYTKEADVITIGILRLSIFCAPYFFCGMMDVTVGSLRGMGYSVRPMIVSLIGVCLFRIIWIYTVFRPTMNLGLLYISYPISWLITFIAHFVTFNIIYNKTFKPLVNEVPTLS